MAKKRYPVISILIAVVWATFFYPAEKKTPSPQAASKPMPAVNAVAAEQRPVDAPEKAPVQPFDPDAIKNDPQDDYKVASRKSE